MDKQTRLILGWGGWALALTLVLAAILYSCETLDAQVNLWQQDTNVWISALATPTSTGAAGQSTPGLGGPNINGAQITVWDHTGSQSQTWEELVAGTAPSAVTITISPCMRGGTCTTNITGSSTTSTTFSSSVQNYDKFLVTVSWTGGDATTQITLNDKITANPPTSAGSTGTSKIVGNTGVVLDAASGATAPTNALQVGGQFNTTPPSLTTGQFSPGQVDAHGNMYVNTGAKQTSGSIPNPCTQNYQMSSVSVNFSGTALTQIVALSGTTKISICSFVIQGGGTTPTLEFEYGTGSNCGTGTTVLMNTITLPTTQPLISPWVVSGPTGTGTALCYILTGTTPTASGILTYVQG